jgi:hypothetical protein
VCRPTIFTQLTPLPSRLLVARTVQNVTDTVGGGGIDIMRPNIISLKSNNVPRKSYDVHDNIIFTLISSFYDESKAYDRCRSCRIIFELIDRFLSNHDVWSHCVISLNSV